MSDTISAVKSNLGKLLASENIRIEHRQIQGPFFDVKERILALPIWKEMDSDLYDLMIGHEVGHALFTPADGWDENVKTYGMRFKQFLNIIEDVRIEKKMKRKYPGLRRPMYNGYTQLVDRGFFGVAMEEMKVLPFADRVNVYFKLGARSNISFTATEQKFIDAVEAAETWEDVVSLSHELFEMANAEKEDLSEKIDDFLDDMDQTSNDSNGESNESEKMQKESVEKQDMPKSLQDLVNSDMKTISQELQDKLQEWADSDAPESITENAMKENEKHLIDQDAYPYVYLSWPTVDLSQWVIPANVVHENIEFTNGMLSRRNDIYESFMASNKAYISYLVKEFELRRNAKQFAKARVSNTGELDMKKIWKHKISEDVFLQSTIVPNGKNHGMLMMIDMSSSMQENISGTLEQVISLSLFCKKVNIPFDVYGFIDNGHYVEDFKAAGIDIFSTRKTSNTFGEISCTHNAAFRMKQLVCSSMRTSEFNDAIKNLLLLAHGFKNAYSYRYHDVRVPSTMALSGTPLNEAVVVLKTIADKFKKDTRVEVLNTIILTDGDSSYGLRAIDNFGMDNGVNFWNGKVVCEDKASGIQQHITRDNITGSLLEMYKKMTDSTVIGFYLMSGRNYKSQISSKYFGLTNSDHIDPTFAKQFSTEFVKHKFFALETTGYTVYYMLPGEGLELGDTNMTQVLAKTPSTSSMKTTLLKAFKKMQNSKNVSRVFLNKFIQEIS